MPEKKIEGTLSSLVDLRSVVGRSKRVIGGGDLENVTVHFFERERPARRNFGQSAPFVTGKKAAFL